MAAASTGGDEDDSRCLLLALSHDELGVIFDGLADPLQPVVAVALSSTCKGLRTPLLAALLVLRQRHERAKALGLKGGNNVQLVAGSSGWRPSPMTCADLRDAEVLEWPLSSGPIGLTNDDMATLGLVLPWMPKLKKLYLNQSNLCDASLQALCNGLGRGAAPSLRMLSLNLNKLGPVGAEALAAALRRGAMPKVEKLCLGGNIIGDQGVAALAPALKKLPALGTLDLGECGIGDAGVASLLHNLGKDDFKGLKELYLDENALTDVGCATVVTALKGGALPAIEALCHPDADDDAMFSDDASEEACAAVNEAIKQRLDARNA